MCNHIHAEPRAAICGGPPTRLLIVHNKDHGRYPIDTRCGLHGAKPRPKSYMVRANVDERSRSLQRLAQVLRRRFDSSSGRSFVMLIADLRRGSTDDISTQPMPVLRPLPENPFNF
jgi:hypothetical protein